MVVQLRLSRLQADHWRRYTEVRRKMNGIQYRVFQPQNLGELRIYGLAKNMLKLFSKYRDQDQLERIKYERDYLGKRLLADAVEAIAEIIALLSIAYQIVHRVQPIGQFILVQQLVSRALGGMHTLANEYNSIDEDLATMVDYEYFMKLPRADVDAVKLLDDVRTIQVENVSFTYPGADRAVLCNISMTVPAGQHIAIVGENGAGKSTLIKLLLGLYTPTEGSIRINDIKLQDIQKDVWHAKLGVLQQEFLRYEFLSIKENVTNGDISRPYSDERYSAALLDAEADEFIRALPSKDKTLLGRWYEDTDGTKGVELSGGQWQRIALARNFYRNAPIIILDEPTSAIDALAESRIFKHLFSSSEKTVIAISHRLSTVRKADVIYMMDHGRIVEQGTYRELVERRGKFYRMFESQIT